MKKLCWLYFELSLSTHNLEHPLYNKDIVITTCPDIFTTDSVHCYIEFYHYSASPLCLYTRLTKGIHMKLICLKFYRLFFPALLKNLPNTCFFILISLPINCVKQKYLAGYKKVRPIRSSSYLTIQQSSYT